MSDRALIARYDYTDSHLEKHNTEKRALSERIAADDMELKQTTIYNLDARVGNDANSVRSDSGDFDAHVCCKSERQRSYIKKIVLFKFLLGYLTYTGFVVYLNPNDSAFICISAVFLVYHVTNYITGGKVGKAIRKCWALRPHIKRKQAIWIRRYVLRFLHCCLRCNHYRSNLCEHYIATHFFYNLNTVLQIIMLTYLL